MISVKMRGTGEWLKARGNTLFESSLVMLVAALLWVVQWAVSGMPLPSGDGQVYLAMAQGAEGTPPFSFHILTPRLAGYLFPDDPAVGFFAIAAHIV